MTLNNLKYIKIKLFKLLESSHIGFWTKISEDRIILMIGINNNTINISNFLADINKVYETENIIISVSDPFTHILSIKDHLEEIKSVISYAQHNKSNKKIYLCDDYKFRTFLKDVNPLIDTATPYISYKVMDILNYDLKNNTEYAITLKTYLSESLSPKLTSESLFIHRNTVIYRINKIKELFNIDFTDADQCFQLYFSFQLLMVRGWGREK